VGFIPIFQKISLEFRVSHPGVDCSFLFFPKKRETNQRENSPAASARLKIESFFLKRPNALRFAPVGRGRFFTEK
jgi:hypothetical protein